VGSSNGQYDRRKFHEKLSKSRWYPLDSAQAGTFAQQYFLALSLVRQLVERLGCNAAALDSFEYTSQVLRLLLQWSADGGRCGLSTRYAACPR
jgi:hypothetical protein